MEDAKAKSLGKKILTIIITVIITLIVLFFILFSWVMIKNPLNVRGILLFKMGWIDTPVQIVPVEESVETMSDNSETTAPSTTAQPSAPVPQPIPMTTEQRQAVEDFGIDPDSIIITPAMEECFTEKLGIERVNEIKAGATPGAMDLLKANSCL